jgi:Icc-related predicted phosphoesterase
MGRGQSTLEFAEAIALREPVRVLMLGDLHKNRSPFPQMVKAATENRCDVLLQVGDFGFWPHVDETYIPDLTKEMEKVDFERAKQGLAPLYLVWIDGNHDNHDALEEGAWHTTPEGFKEMSRRVFYSPRANRWVWSGVSFMSLGGGYSMDKASRTPHSEWWPQETLNQRNVWEAIAQGSVDILVTHDCPNGIEEQMGITLSKIAREDEVNRLAVRAVCDSATPKLLFHGHYHHRYQGILEGENYKTKVVGLDRDGTGEASWEVLDLASL